MALENNSQDLDMSKLGEQKSNGEVKLLNDIDNNPQINSKKPSPSQGKSKRSSEDLSFGDIEGGSEFEDLGAGPIYQLDNFDSKEYTKYLGAAYFDEAMDVARAKAQKTGEQLWHGTVNAIGGAATMAAAQLSSVFDLPEYLGTNPEDKAGNPMSRFFMDLTEDISKANPIYREKPGKADLGDIAYWIENGSNLVKSVGSFLATGAAVGKIFTGISTLAASMGAGVKTMNAAKALGAVGGAVALNQAEAMLDAVEVYDEVYKDFKDRGFEEEYAKTQAAAASTHVINGNKWNILLNMTSAAAFMKAPAMARSAMKKSPWSRIPVEAGQEYLEEVVNLSARNNSMNKIYGIESNMGTAFVDALFSKEGLEVGLWGAAGGAFQTSGATIIDADGARKAHRVQKEWIEQFDRDREGMNKQSMFSIGINAESLNTYIGNMDEARKNIQISIDNDETPSPKDIAEFEYNRNQILARQAWDAFKNGQAEHLENMYKSFMELEDVDLAVKLFGEDMLEGENDYKAEAKFALEQLKEFEKYYNEYGSLAVDGDMAYMSKIHENNARKQIKNFKDDRSVFIEKLEQTIKDYEEYKGKPAPNINFNDSEEVEALKESHPGLHSVITNSFQYKTIKAINDQIMNQSKLAMEFAAQADKIQTPKYQFTEGKKKKRLAKEKKTINDKLAKALSKRNSTKEDIEKLVNEAVSSNAFTDEEKKAIKDRAIKKYEEIDQENSDSGEKNKEKAKDLPKDKKKDNPSSVKNSPNKKIDSEEKKIERSQYAKSFAKIISKKKISDIDIKEAKDLLKEMKDSELFTEEEFEAFVDDLNMIELSKITSKSENEAREKLLKEWKDSINDPLVKPQTLQKMFDTMVVSELFSKKQMEKTLGEFKEWAKAYEEAKKIAEKMSKKEVKPDSDITEQVKAENDKRDKSILSINETENGFVTDVPDLKFGDKNAAIIGVNAYYDAKIELIKNYGFVDKKALNILFDVIYSEKANKDESDILYENFTKAFSQYVNEKTQEIDEKGVLELYSILKSFRPRHMPFLSKDEKEFVKNFTRHIEVKYNLSSPDKVGEKVGKKQDNLILGEISDYVFGELEGTYFSKVIVPEIVHKTKDGEQVIQGRYEAVKNISKEQLKRIKDANTKESFHERIAVEARNQVEDIMLGAKNAREEFDPKKNDELLNSSVSARRQVANKIKFRGTFINGKTISATAKDLQKSNQNAARKFVGGLIEAESKLLQHLKDGSSKKNGQAEFEAIVKKSIRNYVKYLNNLGESSIDLKNQIYIGYIEDSNEGRSLVLTLPVYGQQILLYGNFNDIVDSLGIPLSQIEISEDYGLEYYKYKEWVKFEYDYPDFVEDYRNGIDGIEISKSKEIASEQQKTDKNSSKTGKTSSEKEGKAQSKKSKNNDQAKSDLEKALDDNTRGFTLEQKVVVESATVNNDGTPVSEEDAKAVMNDVDRKIEKAENMAKKT